MIRPFLALAWRWAVRAVVGFVVLSVVLFVGAVLLQPDHDWSRVGGFGTVVAASVFWLVFLTPVLALAGVALAAAVWLALRISHGSTTAAAVTAGVTAAALMTAFVLLASDPRPLDVLGYGAMSVVTGLVTARWTLRDLARIPSLAAMRAVSVGS